jgi:hypothetical protein
MRDSLFQIITFIGLFPGKKRRKCRSSEKMHSPQLSVGSQPVKRRLGVGVKWPPTRDSDTLSVDKNPARAAETTGPESGKLRNLLRYKPLPENG